MFKLLLMKPEARGTLFVREFETVAQAVDAWRGWKDAMIVAPNGLILAVSGRFEVLSHG